MLPVPVPLLGSRRQTCLAVACVQHVQGTQVQARVPLGELVHGLILGLAEKDLGCIM